MADIEVISNYPVLERKRTGLFSLDYAVSSRGDYGLPTRNLIEIFGYPNSGKSTLSYYLSGVMSNEPEITICDLENLDIQYLKTAVGSSGWKGKIKVIDPVTEGTGRPHEEMLQEGVANLSKDSGCLLVDSIGAIQPIAEASGDFGEAFIGKRAKLVAQLTRAIANELRNKETSSTSIIINHVMGIIGGRGHTTPGGDVKNFMAGVRIYMWTKEAVKKSDEDDTPLGFLTAGKIEKLRFGGRGRSFQFYVVPGFGVHPGASAMFDCFELGLADRGTTVKMDGKSMGYIKKEFLDYAAEGKTRKFDPFIEKLMQYESEQRFSSTEWDSSEEVKDEPATVVEPKRRKAKKAD